MVMPTDLWLLVKELSILAEKHQAEILKQREKIKQLERDVEFLLAANATTNTRIAAIGDRERMREARAMRGVT